MRMHSCIINTVINFDTIITIVVHIYSVYFYTGASSAGI